MTYRLKVNDAYSRGLDKDSAVQTEIASNRKLLAESFYFDKKLVDPNIKKLLEYRKKELQIAIVLFSIPGGINPDTLHTYERAMRNLNLIKTGKYKFEEIARDSSDDPDSKTRGGLIPAFITGGKVQRPIEDAIYTLNPGEMYPDLVTTKFGYFIIKLIKTEPRLKIKCSHILISNENGSDSTQMRNRADSLLNLLKNGANFVNLAKKFSQDPSSAQKGGELGGWYSRSTGFDNAGRQLMTAFEEAVYNLKDGEISNKVVTDYGIHIIKRDSSQLVDLETEKDEIKRTYKRLYYEEDKKNLVEVFKKQLNFTLNTNIFNEFLALLDTNKSNMDSVAFNKITPSLASKTLFSISDKNYKIEDFIKKSKAKGELKGLGLNRDGVKKAIDKIVDPIAFDLATTSLENEYPEFASLLKEFKDGILLFKVETQEVFDKLKFDTVSARVYWDSTKTKYKTHPAYDISEIYVMNDSLANEVKAKLKAGEDFEKLAEDYTQRAGYREKKGKWGKLSIRDNKFAQYADSKKPKVGDVLEPMSYEKGFSILKINNYIPIRQKDFNEAISDFAPEFQDIQQKKLSQNWINSIKNKLEVKIYTDKLNEIIENTK
jgi:peptidyl-prolyl cis-trans isomerase SurA